ncbi:TPA: (Fe-S)-binding protein [Candidatus Bathyarchaeota archaeon]|nr:(Fe-S)-binding protein [Candidatus Bathyarchaeota archaeon]
MKKLLEKHELKNYEVDALKCMRCGFCVVLCPIHAHSKWESESPRGRMLLIRAMLEGDLSPNSVIRDRIFECTLCGYCKYKCPAGVKTIDAFRATRYNLDALGLSLEPTDIIEKYVAESGNIFNHPKEARLEWIEYTDLSDFVNVKKRADVVYFIGCTSSLSGRAMGIAAATSTILNELGLNWTVLGEDELCCGNPLLAAGKFKHLEALAKRNVEAIKKVGANTVVTSCPGCYRVLKSEYPDIIGETGLEILHITQLLEKAVDEGKLKFKKEVSAKIVYHDPCELGRLMGIFEPPRKVIENVPGVKLVEFVHNRNLTQCCGAGGLLKATFPDLALNQGVVKLNEAHEVGAETIVSACQTCKLNMMDAIATTNDSIKALDVTELVAKSIGALELEV